MGMVLTCGLFWLCSLRIGIIGDFLSSEDLTGGGALYFDSMKSGTLYPPLNYDFLNYGGLSASTDDYPLFFAALGSLVTGACLWTKLVFLYTDPGFVFTRDRDFDMVRSYFICFYFI